MSDSTLCQEIKQPKLLDQVRQYLRLHHYSIHTERSYVDWIVRFIRFHRMRSRDDLFPAEPKIEVCSQVEIHGAHYRVFRVFT